MWRMLTGRAQDLRSSCRARGGRRTRQRALAGRLHVHATGRKVHNDIRASSVSGRLIAEHSDRSRFTLGAPGARPARLLLGWTPLLQQQGPARGAERPRRLHGRANDVGNRARLGACTQVMARKLVVLLVVGLVLAPAASAKGPHAVLTSGPEAVEAGKAWVSTVVLNEFPRRPHPHAVATQGNRRVAGQLRRVPASMPGADGFKLRMVFPTEGRWRLAVSAEGRRFAFPAIAVGSGGGPAGLRGLREGQRGRPAGRRQFVDAGPARTRPAAAPRCRPRRSPSPSRRTTTAMACRSGSRLSGSRSPGREPSGSGQGSAAAARGCREPRRGRRRGRRGPPRPSPGSRRLL